VAVAAFDGALALAARAITRAVVARALEPSGELRAGNAILNVAFTVGAAVGPGIAGLIVAGFGVQTALLLDAISFYLIACILLSTRSMPELEPEAGRFRERLRAGLDYIRQIPALRQLLVAQSGALVFFAAVLPIEVIYVKDVLGAGDSGYGLLLASWGAGMVLGSIVFASVRRRPLPRLLFFSTLTVAAGYLGLAAAPSLALACAASVLGGTGNGVQWVSAVSAVQELSRQSMQARVVSVLESLAAAMPGVGFVLGGLVASVAEPRATFLVAGVGIIGIVAIASATLKGQWESVATDAEAPTEVEDPIVLELIPAGRTFDAGAEVPGQSKREVRP
jgi:MFS family permease